MAALELELTHQCGRHLIFPSPNLMSLEDQGIFWKMKLTTMIC